MALLQKIDKHPLGPVIWSFDTLPSNLASFGVQPGDLVFDGGLHIVASGGSLLQVAGSIAPASTIYVDGTNGSDSNSGLSWSAAKATIQAGVTAASAGGVVFVRPKLITDFTGDPASYAETIIVPATHHNLSIIGVSTGRTQGGLPQIKKGSGTTAQITIRAAGVMLANLGINGASATGGGILLDDDNSAKTAFGTTIVNCHLKNCKVTATDGRTGGAIMWSNQGNAWQVMIRGNRFYRNAADVVLLGTSNSVPQDVIIEDNIFSGPASVTDVNLYLAGGSGMNGVIVRNNEFTAFPAVGSGQVLRFADMTGCVGMLSGNRFASSGKTFGAAGNGAKIPTTVFITDNYQEDGTTQIART